MAETLRAKALKTLQKLSRISAADDNGYCKCVSCGKLDNYKNMDGGHFHPEGFIKQVGVRGRQCPSTV